MAVARLQVRDRAPPRPRRTSTTRSSSTSGRTRRCCARAARRACACSSRRTGRWARACTRSPASDELDLGAFLYAIRRLPGRDRPRASWIVMGQDAGAVRALGHRPARRVGAPSRPPPAGGAGTTAAASTLAVLLASESDVDDLVPTLVAFQIEWNKIRQRDARGRLARGRRPRAGPRGVRDDRSAAAIDDWAAPPRRVGRGASAPQLRVIGDPARVAARPDARRHPGRLRAPDAPLVGAGARPTSRAQQLERPPALLRQLEHAQPRRTSSPASPGEREDELRRLRREPARVRRPARTSCTRFRDGRSRGLVGELPLLRRPRVDFDAGGPELRERRRDAEQSRPASSTCASTTALRVPAQVIPLDRLDVATRSTRAWATSTPRALAGSRTR